MKNLKKIALLAILAVMFSINSNANCIVSNEYEIETKCIAYDVDDATIKEWWKNFKKGFGKGFEEETIEILKEELEDLGGIVYDGGDDDNDEDGFTDEELNYMKTFAFEQIQTKGNMEQIVIQLEALSANDAEIITKEEISAIFYHDPGMDEILKNILDPYGPYDDTFNFQSTMQEEPGKGFKLGEAVGRLAARLLHKFIKD